MACFQAWRLKSRAERAVIVNKAAARLHARVNDIARLATLEMGRRMAEARGEVRFSGDILACYAQHAEAFLAPTRLAGAALGAAPHGSRRSRAPDWAMTSPPAPADPAGPSGPPVRRIGRSAMGTLDEKLRQVLPRLVPGWRRPAPKLAPGDETTMQSPCL